MYNLIVLKFVDDNYISHIAFCLVEPGELVKAQKVIDNREEFEDLCETIDIDDFSLTAVSDEVYRVLQDILGCQCSPDFPIDEYHSFVPLGEDEPTGLDDL